MHTWTACDTPIEHMEERARETLDTGINLLASLEQRTAVKPNQLLPSEHVLVWAHGLAPGCSVWLVFISCFSHGWLSNDRSWIHCKRETYHAKQFEVGEAPPLSLSLALALYKYIYIYTHIYQIIITPLPSTSLNWSVIGRRRFGIKSSKLAFLPRRPKDALSVTDLGASRFYTAPRFGQVRQPFQWHKTASFMAKAKAIIVVGVVAEAAVRSSIRSVILESEESSGHPSDSEEETFRKGLSDRPGETGRVDERIYLWGRPRSVI